MLTFHHKGVAELSYEKCQGPPSIRVVTKPGKDYYHLSFETMVGKNRGLGGG